MYEIRVSRTLQAPAEHVFELISDHENYKRFRGATSSRLITEGREERNGLGAVRRIALGPIHFIEEITAFERPGRMDYLIREVNLPMRHEGGSILLTPRGERTDVLWTSRFETTSRLFGRGLGVVAVQALTRGFSGMLSQVESAYTRAQT
jgi:uncharacterized protein YndB with AHSA1/START domain